MLRPSRGIVYMIASALGFSVMSVLVKLAARRLPTGEIVLGRALVTLALSYAMVWRAGVGAGGSGAPGARWRLIVRGLLGFGGLAGYYAALAHLPIGDATVIQNTVPLATAVLAWWLLDEQVGRGTAFALAFGVAGVLLVVQPSGAGLALDPVGVAAALLGATCSAFAYVTVRQLARTEHPLVIVLFFPLIATPLAVPWAAYDFVVPDARDALLLLAIGVATQVGQVFLTLGLAAERAASATAVNYLQVCFAMVWQQVVFADTPAPTSLAGAALIVGGTMIAARASRHGP